MLMRNCEVKSIESKSVIMYLKNEKRNLVSIKDLETDILRHV